MECDYIKLHQAGMVYRLCPGLPSQRNESESRCPLQVCGVLEESGCPRLPVTEKITGPNPVRTAILALSYKWLVRGPLKAAIRVRVPVGLPVSIGLFVGTISVRVSEHCLRVGN